MSLRASAVCAALAALLGLPVLLLAGAAAGVEALALQVADGFVAAVDAVGWVFVPQFALAAAILSLALQRLAVRAAGEALEHALRGPGRGPGREPRRRVLASS